MVLVQFETKQDKRERESKKFRIHVDQEVERFTRGQDAINARREQEAEAVAEERQSGINFQRQKFRELISPSLDALGQDINDERDRIDGERTKFHKLIEPSLQEAQKLSVQEQKITGEREKFRRLIQPSLDSLAGVGGGFDTAGGVPANAVGARSPEVQAAVVDRAERDRHLNAFRLALVEEAPQFITGRIVAALDSSGVPRPPLSIETGQANRLLARLASDEFGPVDSPFRTEIGDWLTTIVEGAPASATALGFGQGRLFGSGEQRREALVGSLTGVLPEPIYEAIDKLPVGGPGASRAARFLTSPAGLVSAAVFPAAVGFGTAAAAGAFNVGRAAERLGFDPRLVLNTPLGETRIGPAGFLEAAFGLYGGPGRSAASRMASTQGKVAVRGGMDVGFSEDSARILAGIGFNGEGMYELRLSGLTNDVLRDAVREVITEAPEGALGSAIRGMRTASGGRYLNDLQQGKGYFSRVREALPASAEAGLEVFGRAPARALSAAREGGELIAGVLPQELKATFVNGIARMRQRITANRPLQSGAKIGRLESSERVYRKALAEGKSRDEALSLQRRAQEGPLPRADQLVLDLSDDAWERISRIVDDFDFGRGVGADFERTRVRSLIEVLKGGAREQAIQRNELESLAKILGDDVVDDLARVLDDVGFVDLDVSDILGVPEQRRLVPVDPARPVPPGETPGLGPGAGSGYVDVPGQRRVITSPELETPVSVESARAERTLGTAGVEAVDPQGRVPLADRLRPPGDRALTAADEFPQQGVIDAKGKPVSQPMSPLAHGVDTLKIIQSVQQSFDFSFHFNQGAKLGWRHPDQWAKSFWRGLRASQDEAVSEAMDTQMRGLGDASDDIGKKAQTKLTVGTPEGVKTITYGEAADKWMRIIRGVQEDDYWMSRAAERLGVSIPLPGGRALKIGVQSSENAFTTSGNSLRFDVGYHLLNRVTKGFTIAIGEKELGELGRSLQRLSGRGNIDILGKYKPAIQAIFRAPGYRISSPQSLMLLGSRNPTVRRLAWESLVTWATATGSVMMLMDLAGGELELNPNSTEWGRVRFGGTSYHLWGADQTLARSAMQIVMQSAQGREVTLPDGTKVTPKWETNWKRVLENYGLSGIDPGLGEGYAFYVGENYVGEPVNFTTFEGLFNAVKDVLPLSVQDAWDAYQSDGAAQAFFTAIFAGTGGRTVSYSQDASDTVQAMTKFEGFDLETEEKMSAFRVEVAIEHDRYQTLRRSETMADVARILGRDTGRAQLGGWVANDLEGKLRLNADRINYIIQNQDKLAIEDLAYGLSEKVARLYLDQGELSQKNFDRISVFKAEN